ncbi:methylmalonyl-CoA mutase family protein [Streptomyces alkaliterrae]|uniref:methylmalonyl-CoA mutase n=1 Tax=Streptomyces alkaliterrae TaxID=2213162 RepID=A0A5P0YUI1_9ACTN|nr:methylmalonyl-CoA mutase family protein [Streptomyces alkaliterrae]MBB1260724.1 methylmalonyl-CoA mutase small subunit [Streptomyces alkaliterrae]MQS03965.1 methylmalonyl-CoA mutase [Streptomyces alkaliterrae]
MTVLPDDGLSLAAEFPDATREQWQRLVEGVLRKSDPNTEASGTAAEDALSTTLEDGLRTRPLYTAADVPGGGAADATGFPGFAPFVRGGRPQGHSPAGWDVRQQHRDPDARRANELALADLENGVSSLWLVVGRGGLAVADLPTVLEGVYLDLAPIVLEPGADFDAAARALVGLYERAEVPPSAAAGNLGGDPLGLQARSGDDTRTAGLLDAAADWARRLGDTHPGLRVMTVDALPYHEAGASPAEELGCSLATGVAYLRHLTAAGLTAEQACRQLEFRYAATADQFVTIAKLRAARRLWARVAEVCGVTDPSAAAQRQHVVTSPVMMTRRDPWVNMLRTTVATLAAGVGGADAVTVLPFDHAAGLPDGFARRIARNTSTIVIEESHVARVVDPAGGSWYVESLTDELASAAWEFFQEIERAGGQRAALASGFVAERLDATWNRRREALAHRREPVTGVSEFPLLTEEPVVREPAPEPESGGLPRVRRDEQYEELRARSDKALAETGRRPRIVLAALGSPAAYTGRATFAANLFQAGGIEPVTVPVGPDTDAAAAAALLREHEASAVCLCSADKVYAEQAAPVAEAFRAAGARSVLLAGRPRGELRETLRAAGVDGHLAVGDNAVALLTELLDRLLHQDPAGAL